MADAQIVVHLNRTSFWLDSVRLFLELGPSGRKGSEGFSREARRVVIGELLNEAFFYTLPGFLEKHRVVVDPVLWPVEDRLLVLH